MSNTKTEADNEQRRLNEAQAEAERVAAERAKQAQKVAPAQYVPTRETPEPPAKR